MQHAIEKEINTDQKQERKVIELRGAFQVERLESRELQLGTHGDVDAVRAAGDFGVMKEGINHLREGESHHDEIDAACAHDQIADQQRDQRGGGDRGGQGEPQIGCFIFGRDQRKHVSRHAEIGGVP